MCRCGPWRRSGLMRLTEYHFATRDVGAIVDAKLSEWLLGVRERDREGTKELTTVGNLVSRWFLRSFPVPFPDT
jgi:hypothetical protein